MGLGGGSGSSSGQVDYPEYMKTQHGAWLTDVASAMTTAQSGSSPYAGWTTVNPDTVFGSQTLTAFGTLATLNSVDLSSEYSSAYSAQSGHDVAVPTLSDSDITAAVVAENNLLTSEAARTVVPMFEAGMRDINAVQSSAFAIGRGIIDGDIVKKVAEFDAKLRTQGFALKLEGVRLSIAQVQSKSEIALKLSMGKQENKRQVSVLASEIGRLYSAARLEVDKTGVEFSAKDRTFDLSTYQYGANVLASIAGAAVSQKVEGSMIQGVLGGAFSGAAAGTAIMPGWGTAIGGVLGGIGGFFSSKN